MPRAYGAKGMERMGRAPGQGCSASGRAGRCMEVHAGLEGAWRGRRGRGAEGGGSTHCQERRSMETHHHKSRFAFGIRDRGVPIRCGVYATVGAKDLITYNTVLLSAVSTVESGSCTETPLTCAGPCCSLVLVTGVHRNQRQSVCTILQTKRRSCLELFETTPFY